MVYACAQKGNSKSQYMVAECFANGWGVTADIEKAKEWYDKAACQGLEAAKEKLKSKE